MSRIERLSLDLLVEIMLRASSINDKFALAQVSKLWRAVALDTPLLWSSVIGGDSKTNRYRLPLILQRSGSTTMLHICFKFFRWDHWLEDALNALVPYAARIETLDLRFSVTVYASSLALSAPRLRTFDIRRLKIAQLERLLVPSLDDIRLSEAWEGVGRLSDIAAYCPLVWRVVLQSRYRVAEPDFQVLARKPMAPALRELELRLREEEDLGRVLQIGFSDVVLDTGNVDILARSLLRGVGPLTVFECIHARETEVRDDSGHRRFQSWDDAFHRRGFRLQDVWEQLSLHYNLHKTLYPPHVEHGIALSIGLGLGSFEEECQTSGIMLIPGLTKVEFFGSYSQPNQFLDLLDHIEPPTTQKVPVCVGSLQSRMVQDSDARFVLQTALAERQGNNWIICGHCLEIRNFAPPNSPDEIPGLAITGSSIGELSATIHPASKSAIVGAERAHAECQEPL
ncbi:hypothetical protein B0H11DRAFT_2208564 [Mycena galericulata]|nr:hypothetical protein B0H11DRAFT_2208564 [Mycena galericulata]